MTEYVYNATVNRVIDGDTVEVTVDWGFRRYDHNVPVRILGINAIEKSKPGGLEAKANLESLLPSGTAVVLRTAKPDKYSPRWDAVISTPEYPYDVGQYLISTGWAVPWDGTGHAPTPPWPRRIPT